jgi:hypothetical protein
VIENRWVAETGDFVTREQWRRCVEPGLKPCPQGVREIRYYGVLDLGLVKDATAFAIVHLEPLQGREIILDELQVWQGSHKRPLQVETVVRAVIDAKRRFESLHVTADPWQLEDPIQRMRQAGVPISKFSFGSASLAHLSTTLYAEITSAKLRVFDDQALENEVLGLQVVQTASGWKVDHRAGGYSDRAIAIGMALTEAVKHRKKEGSAEFDRYYKNLIASRSPREGAVSRGSRDEILMARLPWRRSEPQTEQPAESARDVATSRDPMAPNPNFAQGPPFEWRANQKRRRPAPRQLSEGEAEALARAEHARRRAEQEAASAELEAHLAAQKALHEAEVDRMFNDFLVTSLWIDSPENGHKDPAT